MIVKEILDKISESPSRSLMICVGAFVLGIGAATCAFPVAPRPLALSISIACAALALANGIIVKKKDIRLLLVAGFCFLGGVFRYLSADSDPADLLGYIPALVAAKNWITANVGRMLPEPQAGFVDGLLVGSALRSQDLKAAFIATGTAHVMALSGYNITMVGRWLERIFGAMRFGRRLRWLAVSIGLAAFTVMTGAAASLVRAAAMNAIMTIGLAFGRRSEQPRLLAYAACAMLLVSPGLLRTDIGFMLSVAAMLGLIYLAPIVEPFAAFLPERFGIRKTAGETAAATLATLPICLAAFGRISPLSLPANLLLLPFIPWTMCAGFLGAVLTGIAPPLAPYAGMIVKIFADYDIALVRLLSRAPGASVANVTFGPLAGVLMAALIAFVAYRHHAALQYEKRA